MMDRRAMILSATALAGILAMYVEGMLLKSGVHSWAHLLLLSLGGVVALAVAGIAGVRLLGALGGAPNDPR